MKMPGNSMARVGVMSLALMFMIWPMFGCAADTVPALDMRPVLIEPEPLDTAGAVRFAALEAGIRATRGSGIGSGIGTGRGTDRATVSGSGSSSRGSVALVVVGVVQRPAAAHVGACRRRFRRGKRKRR